jgi:hypothetical protein
VAFIRLFLDKLTAPFRVLFSSPLALFSSPRKMMGLSLPVRVAVFVFLTLVLSAAVVVLIKYKTETGTRDIWDDLPKPILMIPMLLIIPAAAWKLVSLWLHEVPTRFPEIEQAWNHGLRALAEHGLSLTSAPLYLIVGPKNAGEARALVESSEIPMDICGQPDGNPSLVWFASRQAIFLVCPGACQVSLLSRSSLAEAKSSAATQKGPEKGIFEQTMDGGGLESPSSGFSETSSGFAAEPSPSEFTRPNVFNVSNPGYDFGSSMSSPAASSPRSKSAAVRPQVDRAQLDEASEKLAYVCELLRRNRLPFCPLNGIMSFLPQQFITLSEECAGDLGRAAEADARVLRQSLGLRAAVVVLVGGMEQESGFRELVRRFGKEIAFRNRIGKGNNDLWSDTTSELLESLGRHAAGAFEDNIYPLFRKDSNLTEIGNTKLYKLLCLSRLRINDRLTALLRNAYATEEKDLAWSLPILGCYFAATGDREDRRAFAASVFDRLLKQVNELDWHPEVRSSDERYYLFRDIFLGLNAVLLVIIGVLIWRRFSL